MAQEVLRLIGYQKAEFDEASKLRTRILRTQIGIAALAGGTVLVDNPVWLYLSAVVALALAVAWLYWFVELAECRSHAERLRRVTLLAGGLGMPLTGPDLLEFVRGGRAKDAEAERRIDPEYFASKKPPGGERLIDMLEESAIWTSNLAKIAAKEAWLVFGGLALVMILALLTAVAVSGDSEWQLGARIVMAMLMLLLSADFLGSAFHYGAAASAAKRAVDLLQRHKGPKISLAEVMLILGDYNSAVESMPPFSKGLYPRHEKRLNEQYRMYLTGPQ